VVTSENLETYLVEDVATATGRDRFAVKFPVIALVTSAGGH
jgi:hypothetical protein